MAAKELAKMNEMVDSYLHTFEASVRRHRNKVNALALAFACNVGMQDREFNKAELQKLREKGDAIFEELAELCDEPMLILVPEE